MDGFSNPLDPNSYMQGSLPLQETVVSNEDYGSYLPNMSIADPQAGGYALGSYTGQNLDSLGMEQLPQTTDQALPTNTGFEDFQPDAGNLMDPFYEEQQPEADKQISRDDELLGFRPPTYSFALLDMSLRRISVNLNARLHGMFFVSEAPETPPISPQPPSFPELTCYRRNLFQVTGSITLPRNLRYILTDIGDRLPILGQELQIAATESVENAAVKLISVPWKTSLNSSHPPAVEDKVEKEPAVIPLDIISNQDMDAEFATFPIAWKRLQFRIATANNGRRRELQQHFVVRLKLVVTLANGAKIPVAEARSAAIIVRGRSPRNFISKKETPVSGEKGSNRKANASKTSAAAGGDSGKDTPSKSPSAKREPSNDTISSVTAGGGGTGSTVGGGGAASAAAAAGGAFADLYHETSASPYDFSPDPDAANGNGNTRAAFNFDFAAATTPNQGNNGFSYSTSSVRSNSPPPPPQPLSFNDDTDFKRPATRPLKAPRISSVRAARAHPYKRPGAGGLIPASKSAPPTSTSILGNKPFAQSPGGSSGFTTAGASSAAAASAAVAAAQSLNGADAADLLYEYFPLPNEEWEQETVDAVYRPHLVHHVTRQTGAVHHGPANSGFSGAFNTATGAAGGTVSAAATPM